LFTTEIIPTETSGGEVFYETLFEMSDRRLSGLIEKNPKHQDTPYLRAELARRQALRKVVLVADLDDEPEIPMRIDETLMTHGGNILVHPFQATDKRYWQPEIADEQVADARNLHIQIERFEEMPDGPTLLFSNGQILDPTPAEMARLCRAIGYATLYSLDQLLRRPFTVTMTRTGRIVRWHYPDEGDLPTDAFDTVLMAA